MKRSKFAKVYKDRLFYNEFEYSIRFGLNEVNVLTREAIDCEDYLNEIDNSIRSRDALRKKYSSLSWSVPYREITEQAKEHILILAEYLHNLTTPYKIVTSMHYCTIYTNEESVIDSINSIRFIRNIKRSQAIVNRPKDTVILKNSKFRHRSYFKFTEFTDQEKASIKELLLNQEDTIRISPSLKAWLDEKWRVSLDSFFIDYDHDGILVLLAMIKPKLIKKTLDIIHR